MIMRLEALERGMFSHASVERETHRRPFTEFWRHLIARVGAGRDARARRVTRRHLATLSDPILRDLGFTPDEIRLVRERRWDPHPQGDWR
jgi:uncharacterized protein YjiS (DUF1127 family)